MTTVAQDAATSLFGPDATQVAPSSSPTSAPRGLQAARRAADEAELTSGEEARVEQQLRNMFDAAFSQPGLVDGDDALPHSAPKTPKYPDELASLQALVLLTALEAELGKPLMKRMPKNTKPSRLRSFEPLAQLVIELLMEG